MGQSLGGGAVPLCGQGGVGVCPRLGCHGLASPEWRTGLTLHLLTHLCLAVFAAKLINIPACWYLYECTADSWHVLRTAVTCPKLSFCSIPWLFGLEMYVSLPYFMQHLASMWQQPRILRLQKRGVVDFTRRRRWLRRRRQDLTRPSPPPQEAPAPSPRQSPAARRTTSIREVLVLLTSLMLCFQIASPLALLLPCTSRLKSKALLAITKGLSLSSSCTAAKCLQ